MSRGKSSTSGASASGTMVAGRWRRAAASWPLSSSGVFTRCSWQPTQPIVSPGMTVVKLCIRLTATSCSSKATNSRLRSAGASKYAEPSGSTGTTPRTRSSVNVPP